MAALPKVGKRVWVLWEGVSVQILDVPKAMFEGLDRQQLNDALSFEAEALTGVPSTDSAIDGVLNPNLDGGTPDLQRFWITQLPASLHSKLDEAVAKTGAKLGGITHPGGLPRAGWEGPPEDVPGGASSGFGTSPSSGEWRRVELWDQLTFSLRGGRGGAVESRVIRSSPGSEGWLADLPREGPLSWMGPGPVVRVDPAGHVVAGAVTAVSADGSPLEVTKVGLPDDRAPADWLRAWAAELTAARRRVPAVGPSAHRSPNRKYYAAGALTSALALGVCLFHGNALASQTAEVRQRADRLELLRKQMTPPSTSKAEEQALAAETLKLQDQVRDIDQRLAALTAEMAAAEKAAAEFKARQEHLTQLQSAHRPAVPELLAALADSEAQGKATEIVVKEVRQEGGGELRLTGLCKRNACADAFANALQTRLGAAGWKVGAAQKRLRPEGGASDFTVVLTPAVLSGLPAVARKGTSRPAHEARPDGVMVRVPPTGRGS